MADTIKISGLPVATTSAAADSIPIIQGGVTKRIHPGAGGGLDADTVSGSGIGSAGSLLNITEANTITGDGVLFRTTSSCSHAPAGAIYWSILQTYDAGNSSYKNQFALGSDGSVQYRTQVAGTWNTPTGSDANGWLKIWNSSTDGNGGQPPAAKSNRTSNSTIGWIDSVDCASGAAVTLPAGGTFETKVTTYGATYNGVKCAIVAGGAMSGTASANLVMSYKRLS